MAREYAKHIKISIKLSEARLAKVLNEVYAEIFATLIISIFV